MLYNYKTIQKQICYIEMIKNFVRLAKTLDAVLSFRNILLSHRALAADAQRGGGLAKLGNNYTPFGLSLTVKGRSEVRAITLHPNFAKPLVVGRASLAYFLYFTNIITALSSSSNPAAISFNLPESSPFS